MGGDPHVMDVIRRNILKLAVTGVAGSLLSKNSYSLSNSILILADTPIIKPKEIRDVLLNPDMGYETFYCFNGDEKFRETKNYPNCSIAYFRYNWKSLEPAEGQYNFELIDNHLKKARDNGQNLAIRFMAYFDGIPKWFQKKATRYHMCYFKPKGAKQKASERLRWSPDYNDPYFLERQEQLIKAFGEKFNNHPDMSYLDIGHIGNSGEWHTSNTIVNATGKKVPMPTLTNAKKIIDWYRRYWGSVPKKIPVQSAKIRALDYAIASGAGWRWDGLGYGYTYKLPEMLKKLGLQEAWKKGPVSFEPGNRKLWQKVNYKKVFGAALDMHSTTCHGKMLDIADSNIELLDDFLRTCGYRLVLRSLKIPSSVDAKSRLPVDLLFENVGVAPPYKDYLLSIRLINSATNKKIVLNTNAKLSSWLPGEHHVLEALEFSVNVEPGEYDLAIGILDPFYKIPEVSLAVEGRGADGWYRMTRLKVM